MGVLHITPNQRIVQLRFDDADYFVLIGTSLNLDDIDTSILQEEPLNAGVIALLIAESFVKLDRNFEH